MFQIIYGDITSDIFRFFIPVINRNGAALLQTSYSPKVTAKLTAVIKINCKKPVQSIFTIKNAAAASTV